MASATTTTNTRTLECLQRSQANSICMYLNAKRYHWYTFGPLFRDLHHLFDEIAMAHFEDMDPFGERLRILGGDASSSPDEIRSHSTVGFSTLRDSVAEMLSEALANERRVIEEMREGASRAEEEHDPGSVDLFSKSIQNHEKYAWFLQETVRRGDGVVS